MDTNAVTDAYAEIEGQIEGKTGATTTKLDLCG